MEDAGQFASQAQFYRMEADAMFELAQIYRDAGDLATADARATQGLAASQRVGDRYYVPRNLTMLADLKGRRGHFAEANALYEQAEDVIEGMLISVDEPYWNSSVAAAMSETYLRHFELVTKNGDAPGAFAVLERVRGRTLAWALKDRKAQPATESDQTVALEGDVAVLQSRLMQTNSAPEREQLLDNLVEYERRLGLAWTRDDVPNRRLPVQPAALTNVENDLRPDEVLLEYVLDDPISFCISVTRPERSQFWNAFEAELSHGLLKIERRCPQRNQIRQRRWKAMLRVSKPDSCRPTAHLNENNCWTTSLNTNDG